MTDDHHDAKTYLGRYAEHNSRLQNWIGAYGGGLASMLVYQFRTSINDVRGIARTATKVSERYTFDLGVQIEQMHHALALSFKLIALALGLQILLLFLNKTSQFALAHMYADQSEWSIFDRVAEWFSQKYIFDATCDIASIGLLAVATLYGMRALGLTG
jgi:hypothetical protein